MMVQDELLIQNMHTSLLSEKGKWLSSLYTFEEERLAITTRSKYLHETNYVDVVFHSFHAIYVFFPLNTKHSYQGYVICDTGDYTRRLKKNRE